MKKFIIQTREQCYCTYEYEVMAETKEDAEQRFLDGHFEHGELIETDFNSIISLDVFE